MPRTFWGYPATNHNLERRAINKKSMTGSNYGPFKFSTCELNGKPGYVFILVLDNIPRE
ncbi:hypothetical protein RhiLY_01488 [Ceratobasidium sp. AG-Ba]|nr:hypothetical protein RhiLY_01488 [Ceratobasidium sp. AG-Ba]